MNKKNVRDIQIAGKRVLVRADLNVPLNDGRVTDDTRIQAALPTIRYLLEGGASVVLCSHLGRPKGYDAEWIMRPVARCLAGLIGRPVQEAGAVVGPQVEAEAAALEPGQLLLLENTRFEPGETKNDPGLAAQLAALCDHYVNDAFGSAHRAHASTEGVAHAVRARGGAAVAGFLMEKELEYLGAALQDPERPFVAIMGGAKISDKIQVIDNLLRQVDRLLIGGGMANTFLKAQGLEVGDSLVENDQLPLAQDMLRLGGDRLLLPTDVVIADAFSADANAQTVTIDRVLRGWRIMDIGPASVDLYAKALAGARTVVWNGPMGVFEFGQFATGTFAVAQILAEVTAAGGRTVIGGGDSAAAVNLLGLADQMSHISTGGGASLEFLEGKLLPGVAVLDER
jgi:phosphoglycerate kinase